MSPTSGSAVNELGEGVLRAGRAGLGGLEAAGSMISQMPGFVAGGLRGLGTLATGGSAEEAVANQQQSQEFLPHWKPQSEFGNVAMEAMGSARETGGEALEHVRDTSVPGTPQSALRLLSPEFVRSSGEMFTDLAMGAVPLGPKARGRRFTPEQEKLIQERLAKEARQWEDAPMAREQPLPEGTIGYENVDPTAEYAARRESAPQAPQIPRDPMAEYGPEQPRPAPTYEGGVPYEDARLAPEIEQARIAQMQDNTKITEMRGERAITDFPLRQEAWELDQKVKDLTAKFESLKDSNPKEAMKAYKDLVEYAVKDYNMTTPDKYTGSMWLDKPSALPIEKTKTLGEFGQGKKQAGAIDFSGFKKEMLDRDPVDASMLDNVFKTRQFTVSQNRDWLQKIAKQMGEKGNTEIDVAPPHWTDKHPDYMVPRTVARDKAMDLLAQIKGDLNVQDRAGALGRTIEQRLIAKKQRGSIDFSRDPEFNKFKDSLPENMKDDARRMFRKYKAELEKLQAMKVKGHYGNRPDTETNLASTGKEQVLKNIPGLRDWKHEIAPLPTNLAEVKALILSESDLSGKARARAGRQLVSGAKMLGFGTQNTIVKFMGQQVDGIMREANRNIEHLILDEHTGFKPLWEKLSDKEVAELWTNLVAHEGKKDLTKADLFDLGLTDKQAEAGIRYRDSLNKIYEILNEARAAVGKKPFDRRLGYIPSRFRGDWVFDVRDAEGNLIHRVGAFNPGEAHRLVEWFQEKHPELAIGEVKHEPMHRFKDPSDAQAGYQTLLEMLAEDDPRVAALESTYQEYLKKQAYDMLSIKKHFWEKKGVGGAEGFKEWKDAQTNALEGLRSTMNYMDHALKWAELQKRFPDIREILSDKEVQKAQPVAVQWANSYLQQAMGRTNKMAAAFDTIIPDTIAKYSGIGQGLQLKTVRDIKRFATMWWLGFGNLGFTASQILQVAQTNPAMMLLMRNMGAKGNVGRSYLVGAVDTVKAFSGLEHSMTALGKEAWEYAKDYRIVEPKMLEEIGSQLDRTINKSMEWIATKSMTAPEKGARTLTYMMWTQFLHEAGMTMGKDLYKTAAWMTDMTMVDYRIQERPQLYKNFGMMGESANALTTFKHNFYSQLWALGAHRKGVDQRYVVDRTGRHVPVADAPRKSRASAEGTIGPSGGTGPVGTALGMIMLFSGLLGLPGREDIDSLIKLWNKFGTGYIPTTRELAMEAPDYLTYGGLSAATGMDWSGKFSAANVVPDDLLSAINPVVGTVGDMAGAIAGLLYNPSETQLARTANTMSPNSMKWATEDYFTTKKGMFLDKDSLEGKVQRDSFDEKTRMLGLRSLKESTDMHKLRTMKEHDAYFEKERGRVLDQAKDALYERKDVSIKLPKLAREYVKLEGDIETFNQQLFGNAETQQITQIKRMLMESLGNPQKLKRRVGEVK